MSKEEMIHLIEEKQQQLNTIRDEIQNIQKKYCEEYSLQPGDECLDARGNKCWFVKLDFYGSTSFIYQPVVNYPKKDGTKSKRNCAVYKEVTKV